MRKNLIPTYKAGNLYTVDPKDIAKKGYKILFMDLDNTFDSYKVKDPSDYAIKWVKEAENAGLTLVIVSNNYKSRVEKYVTELGVKEIVPFACKPFKKKVTKYIAKKKIHIRECLFIGDQLFTDVRTGNNVGTDTLLLEPLTKEDQWFSKIRRIFEKPALKKLAKENLLKEWH